jgi:redox-sensing transcriptional repressor
MNVAIIGIGNLGRAVAGYFKGKRSKLNLVASFDSDPQKINKVISGVKCYSHSDMEKVMKELDIRIAIITVPADYAKEIAEEVVRFGVKGILNFTTIPLNVPSWVFLEEYDMITSIEKVAFFVKENMI